MSEQEKSPPSEEGATSPPPKQADAPKRRRRKKNRSRKAKQRQKHLSEDRFQLPIYQPMEPPPSLQAMAEEDDNFGNRIDYVSHLGQGIDGYYREPMDGGTQWVQRHRAKKYHPPTDQSLTMRQQSWKDQRRNVDDYFNQPTETIMTIRQQAELSRTLRHDQQDTPYAQLSRYEQGQDPAQAWQRFMADLKKGQKRLQKKNQQRARSHKKPTPPSDASAQAESPEIQQDAETLPETNKNH